MKKVVTFISCLLLVSLCSAQTDSLTVSVFLSEAEVVSVSVDNETPYSEQPDSLLSIAMPALSLSETLQQFSTIRTRNYGPKGTLVSGIGNGLSSDHLAVLWNGVPINSPSLGSSDLGNIPTNMFSSMEYVRGNEVSRVSAGTGAGVIHLFSNRKQGNEFTTGYDNLGNARLAAKFSFDPSEKIRLVSNLQLDRALNEFQYEDPWMLNRETKVQHHNNYNRLSFMQSAFVSPLKNLTIDASVWLQRTELNLPEILGSHGESYATQRDSSLRTNIGAVLVKNRWTFQLRSAYLSDNQHYQDFSNPSEAPTVNSKIQTVRWFHQGSATWKKGMSKFDFAVTKQDDFAQTTNYQAGKTVRSIYGFQLHGKHDMHFLSISGGLRYDLGTVGGIPIPNIRLSKQKGNSTFHLSYNRIFRYPDLNELYWRPGGSASLLPENGNMFDAGIVHASKSSSNNLSISLRVFYQQMNELILWVNMNQEYHAQNASNTSSIGAEGKIEYEMELGKFKLKQHLSASYQNIEGLSQVENDFFFDCVGRYSVQLHTKRFFAGVISRYSSPIFNEGSLNRVTGHQEQLLLFDSFIGVNFTVRNSSLNLSGSCFNMADIMDYRNTNVASPGRVLSINLVWKWNTNN